MPAGRLTHGAFNVAAVLEMATAAAPALVPYVNSTLQAIQPEASPEVACLEDAIEVADALCDAIGLTSEAQTELEALVGLRPAPAAGGPLSASMSRDATRILETWNLCGGRRRTCWPRPGSLDEQDAATVWWFAVLDTAATIAEVRHGAREGSRSPPQG